MTNELKMSVSSIYAKGGEKYAFVTFTDASREAEGKIPSCEIVSSKGFTDEEVAQIKLYMKMNLAELKRMAAGVRMIDAFIK